MKEFIYLILRVSVFILMAAITLSPLIQDPHVSAQRDVITPSENLEVRGIPQVPASLARKVKRYTSAYGLPLAGWDPVKREVWLKGISSVAWVSRVEAPGSVPKAGMYIKASGVYDLYFQPQAKYLVYNQDDGGNEAFQMYLYDIEKRSSTLFTDGKSRSTEPVWSHSGERIVYSSSPPGGNGVSLHVVNPHDPKSNRLLVQSTGNYLKAYDWSPNDDQVVYCEFISNTVSRLWLIDIKTGEKQSLSPQGDKGGEYYDNPQFSRNGKGVYVVTDKDSDFRRLAYLDLATKRFKFLTADIDWDVDEFQLTPDGKTLAVVTNEDGISRLYLIDAESGRRKPVESLPTGIISDLKWHNNSVDLAFNYKSPRTPNDVYSLNVSTGNIERWAKSMTGGIETEKFPMPELVKWKSFDGRMISGFLYRPPSAFTGKRPVIVDIHGGPVDQYRPGYGYDNNFFISELGIARIYPNMRGSSGYGKTFLNLDDGMKRKDVVKDIGALLDWIKKQPDLDAERVLVYGESYGGYLALSVGVNYSDRIRGIISDSGPSNLATFIERTEGWRRDVQRPEFGDERDPKIRAFMEQTAPLNNAQKIRKPLLIIQGKNDPRIPVSQAEAIYQAVKKNEIPVWYLLANDEGHTFVKQSNRDFRLYSIILFVQEHLLK
jgi:dipeptidyl aminopeptidase/acylaminoacyl peptidase